MDANIISSLVENEKNEDKLCYEFYVMDEQNSFPNILQKETMKLVEKWGLRDMECVKLRFNLTFDIKHQEQFIKDLLNSQSARKFNPGMSSLLLKANTDKVSKVKWNKLTTDSTNLDILDVVYDSKIVNKETGYIKKDFEDQYEGIQLTDKLKGALVNPEDENYCVFDEKMRNEFLFRVFMHVAVGGSLCQYEDYAGEYFNVTKRFYKDLISATKDSNSNQIVIRSHVFEILEIDDKPIHSNAFNPQNFLYFSVDPYQKTVVLWFNKWVSFW